jgi:tetratricopeptide (TPR) repeat protein
LAGWFSINRNAASEARYLVIADYQNMTNEHLFDHSLTEAIRVSLQQSNHVKVLSPSRISYARDLLRIPENSPLDEKAALAVARREGASAVVAGSIASVGTIFDLSCKIIDAGRGEPVAILHRAASTIEGVLGATDTLCSQLRHNLGESLSQISATNHRLEDLTTSSLQALELHAQAGVLTDRGEFAKAANLLRQAVELDSLFAMAVSDLSYDLRKTGEDSLACYYHARVLPLINRVTEAERFLILELYYGPSFEMDLRKAFENVEQAITRAPDDPEGYSTLGHLAMFIGDTRTALEANRKAAELSSDYASTSWDNSGYALALDSRNDEALDYFRRSKALRPDYYATDCYIAGIHWANGDLDSCEQTLRAVLASADPFRTKQVRVLLASLCYFRGRLVGARGECQAALDLPQSMKKAGDDSYFHYLLAEIAMAGGDAGTFKREMKRSVQQSISPYFELALAGMSYARNGFPREAEDVLSRISAVRSIDPYFVNRRNSFIDLVKGEMDFAARRYAEAQRQFASVPRARSGDPLFWIAKRGLANSMASLGDSSAFAVYSSILNRRGEAVLASLSSLRCGGPWTAWLWPETQVDLAVLLQASGERSKAMAALRVAQELWKGADISYRPALRAKNMLAKLEKQE